MATWHDNIEKFEANWESLRNYNVPEWFKDAKFGIFIHWGVYSVPAFANEWYPRNMYIEGSDTSKHHRDKWGDQSEFGYKDFIPMFKAAKWDPNEWVDLFARFGAKYVVPVAEHHDGFPMYDSALTPWNAARMGPCRDTTAELGRGCRKVGLKFGVSSHRAFNARYYTFRDGFDNMDSACHKLYGIPRKDEEPVSYEFVLDWYARVREMVDLFEPDLLYFDFGWHRDEFQPWHARVLQHYYNHAIEHGYEPVLNFKDKIPREAAVYDIERGKLDKMGEHYWQTDTSISYKSWCDVANDEYRTAASVIHDLVDIVSKNGNLLLNVGPRADGTIPEGAIQPLLETGKWLEVNGQAIYGTRHWTVFGEGPTGSPKGFHEKAQDTYTAKDIRFTTKDNVLYAICLGRPEGELVITSMGARSQVQADKIAAVTMLGCDGSLEWSQEEAGLKVKTARLKPCDHAVTIKIALK